MPTRSPRRCDPGNAMVSWMQHSAEKGMRGPSIEQSNRHTHGQDRLCWVSQKCADQRSSTRDLKARKTEYISLVILVRMTLEIDRGDLPNRVCCDALGPLEYLPPGVELKDVVNLAFHEFFERRQSLPDEA
jgi:hypothetical protein